MSGHDEPAASWGAGEGTSEPRLEPLYYGGPGNIWGDPRTVASIHRTDRQFDLLETAVLAGLAAVGTVMSGLVGIFGPSNRPYTVLFMAVSGWILAAGLGGFAALRVKVSKSGLDLNASGKAKSSVGTPRAQPPTKPK